MLFGMLGVAPAEVLAGNLVPFRSPSWGKLSNQADALSFGRNLWRDILSTAGPRLIVVMGRTTIDAVAPMLGFHQLESAKGSSFSSAPL